MSAELIMIRTWKDLLLPNGHDTHIFLSRIDNRARDGVTSPSPFNPPKWDPGRLPTIVHQIDDFPSKIEGHLRQLVDDHYATQAARTQFKGDGELSFTPDFSWRMLQRSCERLDFRLDHEYEADEISLHLSHLVCLIHEALTEKKSLASRKERTHRAIVVSDRANPLDDGKIKLLWENISPRVFDKCFEELMNQTKAQGSSVKMYPEISPTMFRGYQAVLGKVRELALLSQ